MLTNTLLLALRGMRRNVMRRRTDFRVCRGVRACGLEGGATGENGGKAGSSSGGTTSGGSSTGGAATGGTGVAGAGTGGSAMGGGGNGGGGRCVRPQPLHGRRDVRNQDRGLTMAFPIDASTVTHGIQLAVAPVFLLAGVGAFLNVCAMRLARIVDRARRIEPDLLASRGRDHDRLQTDIRLLDRRMGIVNWAIFFSVLSAVLICTVVVLLFAAGLTGVHLGTAIALLFIASMVAIGIGFALLLLITFGIEWARTPTLAPALFIGVWILGGLYALLGFQVAPGIVDAVLVIRICRAIGRTTDIAKRIRRGGGDGWE